MIESKEIKTLLADSYFQAAQSECDMFRITEILESIRPMLLQEDTMEELKDKLEAYLGEYLDSEKDFEVIESLKEKIRIAQCENLEGKIQAAFEKDDNKGWEIWLAKFSHEVAQLHHENCAFLLDLKLKIPANKKADYELIKKYTPLLREEKWVEGFPVFDFFIKNKTTTAKDKADIHMYAGQVELFHLVDYEKTWEHFEKSKSLQPNASQSERIFGEYYVAKKEFKKAAEHLQKALDLDKDDYENYIVLGDMHKGENKHEIAASWYREGIQKNPGKADLYNRLLLLNEDASYFKKYHQEIDGLVEKISKLDKEFICTGLNNAGWAFQKNSQYEQAEKYYQKAIKHYPNRTQSYNNLAYSFLEKDDLQQCENTFLKSVEIDKKGFDAYWGLVALYRKKGDWEKVISNLKICEKLRPEWAQYIYNDLGDAYEELQNKTEAQQNYLLALENDPEVNAGLSALYDIMDNDLDLESAIVLLGKIKEIKGEAYADIFYYRKGLLFYDKKQYTHAIENFEKTIALKPKDPVTIEYLGICHNHLGNFLEAEKYFRDAIEQSDNNKNKYYNRLGFFLTEQGRYKEAVEVLDKAIALEPKPIYLENRGFALEKMGEWEHAKNDYEKALELAETDKDIFENRLGVFYNNQGKFKEAIEHYQKAIDIFPKAIYHENIGLSYEDANQLDMAEEHYRKAIELATEGKDTFLNRLAFFFSKNDRHQDAIPLLEEAIEIQPLSLYFENLGYAYENLSQLEVAEKNYQQALEIATSKRDVYFNRLGIFYYNQRKNEQAISFYQQAIDVNPKAVYFENLGNAYKEMEDVENYEKALLQAAEFPPQTGEYFYKLGGYFFTNSEDLEKTKTYFNKAIERYKKTPEIEPEEMESIQFLGAVFQKEGNLEKAKEIFEEAHQLDPTNDLPLSFFGKLYLDKGDLEQSIHYYKKALELNDKLSGNYTNVAVVLEEAKRYEEAVECYLEGAKIDPMLYEAAAKVNLKIPNYAGAEDNLRKALKVYPDNFIYLENLASALQNQEKYEEAHAIFEQAMKVAPESDQGIYLNYFGNLYFAQEKYEEAASYYKKAFEFDPEHEVYLKNLLLAYNTEQKFESSIHVLKEILEKKPNNAFALNNLGLALFSNQEFEPAIDCFKKLSEVEPTNAMAYDNLGFAYEKMEKSEEAIAAYLKGVPYDIGFYEKIGKLYFNQTDYVNAEKYIRKAVEAEPQNAIYLANLGTVLELQNNLEESAEYFEKAIQLRSDFAEYYVNLARIKDMQEQYEEAIDLLKKAIELEEKYKDRYLYNLANVFQKTGNLDHAVETYVAAIKIYPEAKYFDDLGALFFEHGNVEAATQTFLSALMSYPTDAVFLDNFILSCGKIEDAEKRNEFFEQAMKIEKIDVAKLEEGRT